MNRFRKAALGLALLLTLAVPGSALAASSSSDTSESLTVASTISMTAPATATFVPDGNTFGQPTFTYDAYVTVISSNNPTGLKVTAKVDPISTAGGINVPTSARHLLLTQDDATGSGATLQKSIPGDTAPFTNASTSVELANADGPVAGRRVGVTYHVAQSLFLVGGEYTSAAHYTATTNP